MANLKVRDESVSGNPGCTFARTSDKISSTIRVKLIRICCILLLMSTLSTRAAEDAIEKIAQDPQCVRALSWIDAHGDWVTSQQIHVTEIPAPEFGEARRGELLKKLFESAGLKVHTDKLGNVVGERPGSDAESVVLFVAHLDTVFPAGTDVAVKRNGTRLEAPGISDNGAGLAALVGLAQALSESRIRTSKTIAIAGDVGEEGEGNLRGVRALVESYGKRLAVVIAIDGASSDHITTQAIASRRFEVSVTGPGGHSWSDFGNPNPITALSRGIVRFSSINLPIDPRSSYNFGVIEGGTSINSIPARAAVKIDLRSEEEAELNRMEAALREAMQSGVKEENSAMSPSSDPLQVSFRLLGSRPAGKLPDDSPLLETVLNVDRFLGNHSRLERSSTDANIPLSLGIPAVALGGGGRGSGSHTLSEWYDPTGREQGLKRLLLISLALAGVQP
ncbi:MAG TPA: M20/M25/M40 family metallo-hydrolase [Candidatus Sulfotelmatobacter sp.]|nr:M20/M25/M40 family metallo-hydrolase [Candidatus Sulfotelmatobacter sp.]